MINTRLFLSTILLVVLSAGCVVSPDMEEKPPELGDRLLQQGRRYLMNDEYLNAIARFNQALVYYEGLDNRTGVAYCHLGHVEATIALGKIDVAKQHLRILYSMEDNGKIDHFNDRVTMLDVKIKYLCGMYDDALEKLEPLLPEFDDLGRLSQKTDTQTLNVIASRTLLAFETDIEQAKLWTNQYEEALDSYGQDSPSHSASLERFHAKILIHQKDYTQAERLLDKALGTYKENRDRRSIAATLRELGLLKIEQKQWEVANDLLLRALKIRTLILDRLGTSILLKDLIAMNEKLGNENQVKRYQEMLLEISQNPE
ncbi:tetratricopeptide repeat protein [Thermodesulfobacteriota bacterium]